MDNYYYTNSLFVGSSNFNLAQELIINAYPDTTQYTYPTPQPLTGNLTLTADEGTFIDGSTSEFSADGPLREPYVVFCQGGTHWTHVAIALEAAVAALKEGEVD